MNSLVDIKIPLKSELFTTARLVTGGVCSLVGLNVDDSEDCKVCVTESLLLLTHSGFTSARIVFDEDDGLTVTVAGEEGDGNGELSTEEEISIALLEALVEKLQMQRTEKGVAKIAFGFGRV